MILIGIISLCVAMLGSALIVLCLPIRLRIDSVAQRYEAAMPLVSKCWIDTDSDGPFIRGKIFFFVWRIDPIEIFQTRLTAKKSKPKQATKTKKPKKYKFGDVCGLVNRIAGSCRINQLQLCIDTGNYTANAMLIPVFTMLNQDHIDLSINFLDNWHARINIQFRLLTIGYHLIQFYLTVRKRKPKR